MSGMMHAASGQVREILEPLGTSSIEYQRQLEDMVAMEGRLHGAESIYGQCYEMVTALEKKIDSYFSSWQQE